MYLIILAAVAGVISGTLWSQLTIFILTCVLLALAIASVLARRRNAGQLILVFVLVQTWSCMWLGAQLSHRLPIDFDKAPVHIAGCVKAPPEYSTPDSGQGQGLGQEKGRETGQRQGERPFVRLVLELTPNDYSRGGLRQARLSWYEPPTGLQTGSCIEGEARLRSPRNFANGLSFDYEANLIYRRIDAIGYLQSAEVTNDLLQTQPESKPKPMAEVSSKNRATDAWVRGLVFGDKSAFSSDQWQLVRDTGTLHLLVVSGLHVGMVALGFGLIAALLVRLLRLAGVPLSHNRSISRIISFLPSASALVGAGGYVLIAGAGIPLQRAWLMLLLMVLIWLYPKRVDRLAGLGLAAVAVLLINPLSWMQAGFWYSFCAVATLLLVFEGRRTSRLSALLLPQLAIVFSMFPASLWLDAQPGIVFVIANLIAVPLVSLFLLPAAFAVAMGIPWSNDLLLLLSDLFWSLVVLVDQMQLPQITIHGESVFILLGVIVLWLSGARTGLLLCGVAVLIPALVFQKPSPKAGVWLLDSGQGQSLLVSDGKNAAVFDTGPAFSPSFSIASAVAVPVLRKQGIRRLQLLSVSHSDNDHAGDVQSLIDSFTPELTVAGQALTERPFYDCHDAGELVFSNDFTVLFFEVPAALRNSDNNSSCIPLISWFGHRILVPGDADQEVERYLAVTHGEQLQSDILIAGHHGSRTSTSHIWLNTVRPDMVWFSAGFANRFGHPHADVLDRLAFHHIPSVNTATIGMIHMKKDGGVLGEREKWQPRWRQP